MTLESDLVEEGRNPRLLGPMYFCLSRQKMAACVVHLFHRSCTPYQSLMTHERKTNRRREKVNLLAVRASRSHSIQNYRALRACKDQFHKSPSLLESHWQPCVIWLVQGAEKVESVAKHQVAAKVEFVQPPPFAEMD